MEIAEKIRAEIQLHELELERLRTALSVIEQYGLAKPAKAPPLLTVRKRVEAKPAAKGGKLVKGKGALPLKGMILSMLESKGGSASIKEIMPEAVAAGRKNNSVYGALDALVKDRLIVKGEGGIYSLPSKPQAGAPQAVEPEITAEGESEAA